MEVMNNKILPIFVAVIMTVIAVVLVLLLISHVSMGIETSESKWMLVLYVAMLLYAAYRIYSNLRDIFGKR